MNQKGKVFSLIAVSGAMLFSFAIFGKNFDFSGVRALDSETIVNDVIDFDGSKVEKISDKSPYISRTTTKQGDYVYLACKSDVSLSSDSVASFRSILNEDADKIDSIIKFYSHNGSNYSEYAFQDINSISIVSSNTITSIGVYKSGDGTNYEKIGTMSVNTYDSDKYVYTGSFAISSFEDEYLKLVQESRSSFKPQIKQVVLGYSCDNSYVPPIKHEISSTPTENGSITLSTTKRKAGATASFTVQPADGYIVSSVTTVPEVALSVSGSNYSFIMPESDISINATFEPAPVVAYSVSAQASSGGSVSFEETEYYEGESVAFTVNPNNGYEINQVSTSPSLTVSGSDGSYSFIMPASDVEVVASYKQISSLSFSGNYQTEFDVDDTFNYDNLVVTANYSDSTSRVLGSSEYNVSSPDMSSAGSKSVSVSYRGVSNSYNINVVAPDAIESIEVSGTYKTNYYVGDTVDHSGVVVKAVYTSGTKADVTSDVSFTDPSMTYQGTKFVTVTYGDFSTKYQINVTPRPTLSSISLYGQTFTSNTKFNYGDTYSLKNITVTANYSNPSSSEDVTDKVTCSGYNMNQVGSQTVTVTYNDGYSSKSTTYNITVNDVLDYISYEAGQDAKTTYVVGESFDPTGFTIYKHMKSGATSDVTSSATFNAPSFSAAGNYNVVVSYTGASDINIPVTVIQTYSVSQNISGSGSLVGLLGNYAEGDDVEFTVSPASGYEFNSISFSPEVEYDSEDDYYYFVMPAQNVTVSVVFTSDTPVSTYFLTAGETENGTLIVEEGSYEAGTSIEVLVEADSGYEINEVYYKTVSDVQVDIEGEDGDYFFEMPDENITVYATFKEKQSAFDPYAALANSVISGTYTGDTKTTTITFNANGTGTQTIVNGFNNYNYTFSYSVIMTSSNQGNITFTNVKKTSTMTNWLNVGNATSCNATFNLTSSSVSGFELMLYSSTYGNGSLII